MNVDAYALKGEWADATARVMAMMDTGIAADSYLPEGPSSSIGIERYARILCENNPRADLGIMYGLAGVAICVAAQGGIVAKAPIVGGGWLTVPAVMQFLGVAPSGWRKSSALGVIEDPLERALAAAVRFRRKLAQDLMHTERQQIADANVNAIDFVPSDKQINEVFSAGACPFTLVKDPTVESLRNMAVYNGGCVGALAGEADVFRNITQYSQDAASLTFFLDLWDQSKIATSRVGAGMMQMEDAALFLAVLFQTDVFAEVTSGGMGGRGGSGADSFLSRGIFGRMWVVETDKVEGFADVAAAYADDVEHTNAGLDGHVAADGTPTALGMAAAEFEQRLYALAEQTSEYRMYKALAHAWVQAASKYGTDLQVAEIEAREREVIYLKDRAATVAYNRVQRMYNALEAALDEMDEDAKIMWGPLVARYVQHTMREALVIALADGRREITGVDITDAATRLIPWRWALTTRALSKRQHDRVADLLALASADNPRGEDRTPEGRVLAAMSRMVRDNPDGRADGFTEAEVLRKVTGMMNSRSARKGVASVVRTALQNLVADPKSGVNKAFRAVGKDTVPYFIVDEWVAAYN